jgi:hypothetical protein
LTTTPTTPRRARDEFAELPINHGPQFAPAPLPTLRTGVETLVTAMTAWGARSSRRDWTGTATASARSTCAGTWRPGFGLHPYAHVWDDDPVASSRRARYTAGKLDGRQLAYHNDTATRVIAVYSYDREAGLTDRRVFASLDRWPDGLTVDAEGGVWTGLYDGGAVHRYTPEGDLDAVIEVPARKVTACTFGGVGLDELFITTSREGLQPGDDPLAGALFRAVPGVRGLPVREFAG